MSHPEVSVIIPAYYSDGTVCACLAALERQTFPDFEIIIVDSTPDGRTSSLVKGRFPRVRVYQHPHRLLCHTKLGTLERSTPQDASSFLRIPTAKRAPTGWRLW